MMELLTKLFAASNPLWYYYPLAIVVGIVYKTTQYDDPKAIAKGVLHFFLSVTAFMLILAVVLYGLSEWI
ncbi:MAG: hypothetical protein JXL80_06905 [Planctomycetes bacterium]|nr:hypothetical protein [Planctomycetota bacterium]